MAVIKVFLACVKLICVYCKFMITHIGILDNSPLSCCVLDKINRWTDSLFFPLCVTHLTTFSVNGLNYGC